MVVARRGGRGRRRGVDRVALRYESLAAAAVYLVFQPAQLFAEGADLFVDHLLQEGLGQRLGGGGAGGWRWRRRKEPQRRRDTEKRGEWKEQGRLLGQRQERFQGQLRAERCVNELSLGGSGDCRERMGFVHDRRGVVNAINEIRRGEGGGLYVWQCGMWQGARTGARGERS